MPGLKYLNVAKNRLQDVRPLASLSNLAWLELQGNDIANIDALAGQTIIDVLDSQYHEISDNWRGLRNPEAFGDDYRVAAPFDSGARAYYEFTNLSPGTYDLQATWLAQNNYSSGVVYAIDNGPVVANVSSPFISRTVTEPTIPTLAARDIEINTDTLLITGDDDSALTFYGQPFSWEQTNNQSYLYVQGDLTIPAGTITLTGYRAMALVVGNNLVLSPGVVLDASARTQVDGGSIAGPGGGSGGFGGGGGSGNTSGLSSNGGAPGLRGYNGDNPTIPEGTAPPRSGSGLRGDSGSRGAGGLTGNDGFSGGSGFTGINNTYTAAPGNGGDTAGGGGGGGAPAGGGDPGSGRDGTVSASKALQGGSGGQGSSPTTTGETGLTGGSGQTGTAGLNPVTGATISGGSGGGGGGGGRAGGGGGQGGGGGGGGGGGQGQSNNSPGGTFWYRGVVGAGSGTRPNGESAFLGGVGGSGG